MRTVLRVRKKSAPTETVSVALHARLTEIGTLDLWLSEIGGRRSWRLQFDVRSATQTDVAAHQSQAEDEGVVDEAIWQQCQALIEATFGPEKKGTGPICAEQPPRPFRANWTCPLFSGGKRQARGLGEASGGGHRHGPQHLAHVAVPADLGGADGA